MAIKLIKRKGITRTKLNQGLKNRVEKEKRSQKQKEFIHRKNLWEKVKKSKLSIIYESYYDGLIKPKSTKIHEFWQLNSFEDSVLYLRRALSGTLFNDVPLPEEYNPLVDTRFTIDDILKAIEIHKIALTKDYYPTNKRILKVHLNSFLLNIYTKTPMMFSFLAYWTIFDVQPKIPRIDSVNTGLLDKLMIEFKETLPIRQQNMALKTLDNIINDIETTRSIVSISWESALLRYMKEECLYPSDLVNFKFRKQFVKYYKRRYGS